MCPKPESIRYARYELERLTLSVSCPLRTFIPTSSKTDLTLKCISCHYINEPSLLSEVLYGYFSSFRLFNYFKGYVEFFLLQVLTTDDFSEIKFILLFNNFKFSPVPLTLETYISYKNLSIIFLQDRNQ